MNCKKLLIILILLIFSNFVDSNAKEVNFILQKEVQLKFTDEAPIGEVGNIVITNNSIILSDKINNYVYEFDLKGKYIKTIGGHGQGPGEYLDIRYITNDHLGNLIICDNSGQRINIYNRNGEYIGDFNKSKKFHQTKIIKFLQNKYVIQLESYYGIDRLNKCKFNDLSVIFTINPTTEDYRIINLHFGRTNHSCFAHSSKHNSIYYISPCDYKIKEIDDQTGSINKIFGIKPKGYRELPKKYHSVKEIGDPTKLTEIINSITFIVPTSFQIIDDSYLFIGYSNRNKEWEYNTNWQIYDLESVEKPLKIENTSFFSHVTRFCTKDKFLIVYIPPEIDNSNGTIKMFSIDISN